MLGGADETVVPMLKGTEQCIEYSLSLRLKVVISL